MTATPAPALRRARFADLTPFEVYALCRLRVDVFVVEQACPYPELDGRDLEPTTEHLWFEADGEIAALIRVLENGARRAIGRVASRPPIRQSPGVVRAARASSRSAAVRRVWAGSSMAGILPRGVGQAGSRRIGTCGIPSST